MAADAPLARVRRQLGDLDAGAELTVLCDLYMRGRDPNTEQMHSHAPRTWTGRLTGSGLTTAARGPRRTAKGTITPIESLVLRPEGTPSDGVQ